MLEIDLSSTSSSFPDEYENASMLSEVNDVSVKIIDVRGLRK